MRSAYVFALLAWLVMATFMILPFVGPLAVAVVIALRWYWTTMSPRRHYAGLLRHTAYALIGPLALVGSIVISSWLPTILHARGFDWPMLSLVSQIWDSTAMPLAGKILGAYAGAHDAINAVLGAKTQWIPTSWSQVGAMSDPSAIKQAIDKSLSSLLAVAAVVYVSLSNLNHVSVALGLRVIETAQREAQEKLDQFNREQETALREARQQANADLSAAAARPATTANPGKSGAFEF